VGAAGIGAGEGEVTWTGAGEEPGFRGNEGCKVFCVGIVGTGWTITGGAGVVAVAVDSGVASDIFTSFGSGSTFCWA
jgi:hypothetical protein